MLDDFGIVAQPRDLLVKEAVILIEGLILSYELMVFTMELSPLKEATRVQGEENGSPREEGKAGEY